ncbi:m000.5L [Myxoma virus]|nr:m000.5L [Myxoma virus]
MVVRRVSDDVDLSYTRLFRFGGGRVYVCPRIDRVFVFLRLPEEIEYIDRPRSSRGYDVHLFLRFYRRSFSTSSSPKR